MWWELRRRISLGYPEPLEPQKGLPCIPRAEGGIKGAALYTCGLAAMFFMKASREQGTASNSTSFCELHPPGQRKGVGVKLKHIQMHLNLYKCSKWESWGWMQYLWPYPTENGNSFGESQEQLAEAGTDCKDYSGPSYTLMPLPALSEDWMRKKHPCVGIKFFLSQATGWASNAKSFTKIT